MKEKKNRGLTSAVVLLFLVTPFVMSFDSSEVAELLSAKTLPTIVGDIASVIRWLLLLVLTLASITFISYRGSKISAPVFFMVLFYFAQFLYAMFDGNDYFRFFLLTILCLFIPPIIGEIFKRDRQILSYFSWIILFFLLLSLFLNGSLILSGLRFFGFLGNPNTYGISCVFWLLVLFLAEREKLIGTKLLYLLATLIVTTVFFSGSRNGSFGVLLLLLIHFITDLKKILFFTILFCTLLFVLQFFLDLNFFLDRFSNLSGAAEDSGRQSIWDNASFMISQNPWWGNGMEATLQITGSGNMHNVYLRFILNMGVIFTVFVFLMYLMMLISTVAKRNTVSLILPGYLLIYALMNLGEDFFVGVGSAAFVYMLFVFGFINYYYFKDDTRRQFIYK
jgi:O-antigen ligase